MASVDGQSYPIVIDAGAGYSWMRGETAGQWLARHAEWQRADGAVGQSNANMVDYDLEKKGILIRVPEMNIGAVGLQNVGILGTGSILGHLLDKIVGDLFWDNWQKSATGPVVGWIGGNVLRDFKITIDYPNRMLYWQRQRPSDSHDLDQPGITLVRRNDRFFIGGIVQSQRQSTVDGLQAGDELISIDGLDVKALSKDAMLTALHGKPGERRNLTIERQETRHVVEVVVSDFS
jgi:hypothetical protein